MRLFELTGYKSHPIAKAAANLKPTKDKKAQMAAFGRWQSYNVVTMDKFIKAMGDEGWHIMGEGHHANVFEHPNYPFLVKVFVDDAEYMKYFKIMRAEQGNPHVPKTRGKFMPIGDQGYAVRIEKLNPISGVADPIFRKYIDPHLPGTFTYLLDEENFAFLQENWPQLYDLMMEIFDVTNELDWHTGNIMKRGDTLVIIDPLA